MQETQKTWSFLFVSKWTVVLTGGIGSGKSVVAAMFESLAVQIVEQDVISREVVMPGTNALSRIAEHFGVRVLNSNGSLNRESLRQKIFESSEERRWLERLLHPLIGVRTTELVEQAKSPYVIVVNPLLRARSGSYDFVLVVDVPTEVQVQRIVERDGISTELAKSMIASQIERTARLAIADEVIENTGTADELIPIIARLHQKFLNQASQQTEQLTRFENQ